MRRGERESSNGLNWVQVGLEDEENGGEEYPKGIINDVTCQLISERGD